MKGVLPPGVLLQRPEEDNHFFIEQPLMPETMSRLRKRPGQRGDIPDMLIIRTINGITQAEGYTYSELDGQDKLYLALHMPTMEEDTHRIMKIACGGKGLTSRITGSTATP